MDLAGARQPGPNQARHVIRQRDHAIAHARQTALKENGEVEAIAWVDFGVMNNDHDWNAHSMQAAHKEDVPIPHHGDDGGIGRAGLEPVHDRAQGFADADATPDKLSLRGIGVKGEVDMVPARRLLHQLGAVGEREQRLVTALFGQGAGQFERIARASPEAPPLPDKDSHGEGSSHKMAAENSQKRWT